MKNPLKRGQAPTPEPGGVDMSLVEHLGELRSRLIKCVVAVVVGAIVVWVLFDPLFNFLSDPYCELRAADVVAEAEASGEIPTDADLEAACEFLVTKPLEGFSVQLTLSGYGGLIMALPIILYQLGRFVLPGLYPNEKKVLIPVFLVSVLLLLAGMTLGYLFLPRALDVLTNDFGSDRFESFFSPQEYLDFFVKMILAFGLAFELPLVLVFLQAIGLVQNETLRNNRRVATVVIVILAAVITPTGEPFTLLALSGPMYIFYEISLIIGKRISKRRELKAL